MWRVHPDQLSTTNVISQSCKIAKRKHKLAYFFGQYLIFKNIDETQKDRQKNMLQNAARADNKWKKYFLELIITGDVIKKTPYQWFAGAF